MKQLGQDRTEEGDCIRPIFKTERLSCLEKSTSEILDQTPTGDINK